MTMGGLGGLSGDSAARQAAAAASSDAASAKRDIGEIEHEIGKLKLVCASLWELVKQKTTLTEEDLVAKMLEVDGRDGTLDGQMRRMVRKCVACQRTVAAKLNKCMYCGAVQPVTSVFESL